MSGSGKFQMKQQVGFKWKARDMSPGGSTRGRKEDQNMVLIMRFVIKWFTVEVKISRSRKRR